MSPKTIPTGRRWVRPILGLAPALGLLLLGGCREPASQAAPPPPVVGVVQARQMDVPLLADTTGTTRSLQEVTIRARVGGFLTERNFEEGSFVRKGTLLFVIDEEPYQVTLKSAQAKRDKAEAELRKAKASKAREVARAQVAVDQAQLALARIEEYRQRALVNRNAASQQEVDQAAAQRQRYEAQVEADKANLEQAVADYDVNIAVAQAVLDEAEAAVRTAELDLGYCRMYAPIDGRIGVAQVKVGNLVGTSGSGGTNTELATIQQLDPMGVDLQVSSLYLGEAARLIQEGLTVHMSWPGPEGEQEHPYEGVFYFYDNAIDALTSTFLVKARVPNPNGTLLPGEYVKLDMTIGELEGAVVVPEQAVAETQAGPVVYLVDDGGKVAVQKVDAEQTYKGLRVVSAGLKPGQDVIVEGVQLVRPGIPVKAEPAMLPAPAHSEQERRASAGLDPRSEETVPPSPPTSKPAGPRADAKPGPGGPRSAVRAAEPPPAPQPEADGPQS